MTPERWREVNELLEAALERPPGERPAFLGQACGHDPALRREVESLLSAEETEDFLEQAAFSIHAEDPSVGRRIGPYRTVRLLGRGGMAAVYLAVRQDDYSQQVALKLIKRGMDTDEIVRRFRSERQILANLDHPNIARLLDGGTTDDGLPYFAMEYVEGEPIDHYCDARRLPIRQRLEVFRQVCAALSSSHQSLVVHRDLKPDNILVTADGVLKLLDFGIAKLLQPELAAQSTATAPGLRCMTPSYASPEQVRGEAITTASDIYSLGVVLYELLTGHHPCRPEPGEDLVRAICEKEPKKPSTAVQHEEEIHFADGAVVLVTPQSVSRTRDGDAQKLRRSLTGDLDAIVLKALRKEPRQRYSSIEQLSEDLHRHWKSLPVIARKGTLAYTAGKFVRRNRMGLGMAALLLLLVVGFTAALAYQLEQTEQALERAQNISEFLKDLVKAANPNRAKGEEVTVREILDIGKQRLQGLREGEYGWLAGTLGEVYYNLGSYEEARPLLEDYLRILRSLHRRDHPDLATAINNLAAVLEAQGHYQQAEGLFREALDMTFRLHGEEDPEVVMAMNNLATVLMRQGELGEAETLYRRGLVIRRRLDPPDSGEISTSLLTLGTLLLDKGDYEEAELRLREALRLRRRLYGSEHTGVATVLNNLGMVAHAVGHLETAQDLYGEALDIRLELLGEDHPAVARTETNLASLLTAKGSYDKAEALARHAVEVCRESGISRWRLAYAQSVLGASLVGLDRYEEAELILTESYQVLLQYKSECAKYTRDALNRIVFLYEAWGKPEEADQYQALAEKCLESGVSRDSPAAVLNDWPREGLLRQGRHSIRFDLDAPRPSTAMDKKGKEKHPPENLQDFAAFFEHDLPLSGRFGPSSISLSVLLATIS